MSDHDDASVERLRPSEHPEDWPLSATRDVGLELVAQASRHEAMGYLDNAQKRLYILSRALGENNAQLTAEVSRISQQLRFARDAIDKIKVATLLPHAVCLRIGLERIVGDALDEAKPILERYSVRVVVRGEAPDVLVVPDAVRLALLHLIQNTVTAFQQPTAPQRGRRVDIVIAPEENDFVRLTFTDNAGINPARLRVPEEMAAMPWQQAIFERGTASGSGTGLGLFLARKLVDRAGGSRPGSIELVSGRPGAAFALRFPAQTDARD
jgi:signal transduction histidine kinase